MQKTDNAPEALKQAIRKSMISEAPFYIAADSCYTILSNIAANAAVRWLDDEYEKRKQSKCEHGPGEMYCKECF